MRPNNKMSGDEIGKVATLLWCMGERGTEIFNSLFPNNGDIDSMFSPPNEDQDRDPNEKEETEDTDIPL